MWTLITVGVLVLLVIAFRFARARMVKSMMADAENKLKALEDRDFEMFSQGKSFDEIMSQYKRK